MHPLLKNLADWPEMDNQRITINPETLLSWGSTVLDLECSGHIQGGMSPGCYALLIGGSSAGKTWLSHQICASACAHPFYDKYNIIYDIPEQGALMDIERFFGARLAARIQPPTDSGHSNWLDDFYMNATSWFDYGPTIYVIDSIDSLDCYADSQLRTKQDKQRNAGKDVDGSYGMARARMNSDRMRQIPKLLKKHESMLIVISQSRDSLSMFSPETRGGGRALTFYAHLEIWMKIVSSITTTVCGKPRPIGSLARVKIEKNRLSGKRKGEAVLPIIRNYGIDDLWGCLSWLAEEGMLTRLGGSGAITPATKFKCDVLGISGNFQQMAAACEETGAEDALRQMVLERWTSIEAATVPQRNPKNT